MPKRPRSSRTISRRSQRERDDLLDTTRRLQADFENYRKRVVREQTALVERSTEGLLEQLLPVLDSFELAVRNLESGSVDEQGPQGHRARLRRVDLGGRTRRASNASNASVTPFDPNEHEAVMQDDGDGEPHVADGPAQRLEVEGARVCVPRW